MENTLVLSELKSNGLSVLPDNKLYKNRFEIESESSNRLYIIAQNKETLVWSCSCFGWIRFRKCKHLDSLKPLLDKINKLDLIEA